MSLSVDELVTLTGMSEDDLYEELVLTLYQQRRISQGVVCRLLKINIAEFGDLLSRHNQSLAYSMDDYEHDVATLKQLGQL